MTGRTRFRLLLISLLAGSIVATVAVRWEPAPASGQGFEGALDLGHGVHVRRVDVDSPTLHLVVATAPRRKGVKLRAVQVLGREPISRMAKSVGALAAVNGDYHEMPGEGHSYLVGKTYSTLVEGGDSRDLAHDRVLVNSCSPGDASFYLDEARVPHVERLEIGVSLGLAVAASQGLHDRRAAIDLVTEPLPGRHKLIREVAYPLERAGDAWRVKGPAAATLEGPSLVVAQNTVALVTTAIVPGTVVRVSVAKRVDLAIGTGPRLLSAGEIPQAVFDGDAAWSRYPRTAVGFSADSVFLVATVQQAHNRASMVELAKALKGLGCTDAVNLDGGPSTGLWADGRMLTDTPDFENISDTVGSALCIVPGTDGVDDVR